METSFHGFKVAKCLVESSDYKIVIYFIIFSIVCQLQPIVFQKWNGITRKGVFGLVTR